MLSVSLQRKSSPSPAPFSKCAKFIVVPCVIRLTDGRKSCSIGSTAAYPHSHSRHPLTSSLSCWAQRAAVHANAKVGPNVHTQLYTA